MSVITAVTAQNSISVSAVHYLPPEFVQQQIETVLSDYGATAVKTGFLGRADLISVIAASLPAFSINHIVVDPVLVNHMGVAMFAPDVVQAYREFLLPLASLITPNWREAALLADLAEADIQTPAGIETAVSRLHDLGAKNVLITGAAAGNEIVDWLSTGGAPQPLPVPKIVTSNTHGSGDTLSAAIAAFLARGEALETAVQSAQKVTAVALQKARHWRLGAGHGPLCHFDLA